ncbi:MAG: MMPL family transporter [Alcanivoracaceae bacterium]|jgi:predicted RND superfamily exporter protein|nr:MMPL family transporter [Alcanivoracaceae bacterium]
MFMLDRWNRLVVDYPWTIVLLTLILAGMATFSLRNFQNNNDPRIFFTEENPDFRLFRELEDRFTSNEAVFFIIHPSNGDIFTRDNLVAMEELTEAAWTLPNSTRVDSLVNFQHTEVDADDLTVNYLVENAAALDDEAIARIRRIALAEPSLIGRNISPTGHVAGVVVTVTMDEGSRDAPMITEASRALAQEFGQRYPDIEFMLTGTVVFSEATKLATDQAMTFTLPLAFLAMLVCLLLILRSPMFTGIVVIVVMLSIAMAMGLSVWLGIEFSPIVGMAPAMILTLAVADCVHILATYRHERLVGKERRAAMLESLRVNFQPVWLTSLTTAIGFAILNFSESQPFRALGDVVFMGVLLAFILSVALLPALVMLIPHRITAGRQTDYQPAMTALADWVIGNSRRLLLGMGAVVLALIACVPLNTVNDVFNEYFDTSFEVRRVNDFAMRELTGMHRIDYMVPSGEAGGAMEPEYLKNLDRFTSWLEQQPEVIYVSAYTDVIKRLNRDLNGGDPEFYRVPDSRELVSQYTLMYELSLPQGLGLESQLDINKEYGRVVLMLKNIGSHPVLDFNDRAEQWMQNNWPQAMQARGTGMDILFGRVTMKNIESMLTGAALALVSVSLLLILALRSWWYGFLSLLPNLLPAGMAFGLWALISGEIGLAVSVVACMTLGIVVDDTVHFLSKYVRAKREHGLGTADAVRYAFRTVGVALIATSVVLVANFAVIGTSNFYPNSSMGQLSAITIAMALVVDFFFFVPLLIVLDQLRRGGRGEGAVVT